MTPDTIERHESVEDLLGPAAGRFFGLGYRLTDPRLREVTVTGEASTWRLAATADAVTGAAWSRKGDDEQEPHLSTTDLVVLGVATAYELLAQEVDLQDMTTCWVASIDIRAPRRPIEGDLAALPVVARAPRGAAAPGGEIPVTVDVAGFSICVVVRRPVRSVTVPHAGARSDGGEHVNDRPGDGVYCGVYRSRSPRVGDVAVVEAGAATEVHATVTIPEAGRRPADELCGFEAAYQPGINLVDAFVATLQLGQVLLYRLDDLDRADSDTLWMRRTVITVPAVPEPVVATGLRVALERARAVELGGRPWRLTDVVGSFGNGVQVSCSVAHAVGTVAPAAGGAA